MDNKIFIYIGLALLFFWMTSPVPYCKITEKQISAEDVVYTSEDIQETKNLTFMLLSTKGESMLPSINDNSECLCIKKENYEIGDIVLFFVSINGEFMGISHRIVALNSGEIFTKGDNNNWTDPPMTKESIVCSIPYVYRYYLFW